MSIAFLVFFLAAMPVLTGRIADSRDRPLSGASVRVRSEDGRVIEQITDNRGAFRVEVAGKFRVEVSHDGFRTVRSSIVSLAGNTDDVYQVDDIRLINGSPDDPPETILLQLQEVA